MEIDRVEKGRLTALQCRKNCIMLCVCNFQHNYLLKIKQLLLRFLTIHPLHYKIEIKINLKIL
jgi:hypothetical protein